MFRNVSRHAVRKCPLLIRYSATTVDAGLLQNTKPHETMDYLRCHISTQSSKLCHADPFYWIELSGTFVDLIARPHGNMFQLEHAALVDLHTRRRRLRDGWHGSTLKIVKPDMGRVASHAELLITLLAEKCEQINKGHAQTQNAAGSSRHQVYLLAARTRLHAPQVLAQGREGAHVPRRHLIRT